MGENNAEKVCEMNEVSFMEGVIENLELEIERLKQTIKDLEMTHEVDLANALWKERNEIGSMCYEYDPEIHKAAFFPSSEAEQFYVFGSVDASMLLGTAIQNRT